MYVCIYTHTHTHTHTQSILYPVICGWALRLLHFLAIVTIAAMNVGVYNFFWKWCFPFHWINTWKLLDEIVVTVLIRGISVLFSIVTVPIYIPVSGSGELPSLHILKNVYCFFFLFDNSHSDRYKVISHCGLTWIPVISNFSCACWLFVCLWKNVHSRPSA